jgi:RHS repeat-associated protein
MKYRDARGSTFTSASRREGSFFRERFAFPAIRLTVLLAVWLAATTADAQTPSVRVRPTLFPDFFGMVHLDGVGDYVCLKGSSPQQALQPWIDDETAYWGNQPDHYNIRLRECNVVESYVTTDVSGQACTGRTNLSAGKGYCVLDYYSNSSGGWALWGSDDVRRAAECPVGSTRVPFSGPEPNSWCEVKIDATCPIGNPTSPRTGVKYYDETDYRIGSLELKRYYSSAGAVSPGRGANLTAVEGFWKFSFEKELVYLPESSVYVLTNPSGHRRYYDSAGVEVFNSDGAASKVTSVTDGWIVELPNGDTERYNAAGKLTALTTQAGASTTINRSSSEQITTVVGPFGHTLTFLYGVDDQVESVSIPGGQSIHYWYSDRRLERVTYADGYSKIFKYEDTRWPHLLTGVVDESNQRFATYSYDYKQRVVSSEHGSGADRYTFTYGIDVGGGVIQDGTVITDPLGATGNMRFKEVGGVNRVDSVEGARFSGCGSSAKNTYNSTTGNITSKLDFRGYMTKYVYSSRNLETSRTEGLSNTGATTPSTRVIGTEWHPTMRLPTKIFEGSRTTTFSYDAQGNRLTKTITDGTTSESRIWSYTYDSHGQVLTEDGPRTDVTDVTTYEYYDCSSGYQCGRLRSKANALGQTTNYLTYDADGQLLTSQGANGEITTLTYDLRQHLKSRTVGTESTNFDYWPTGLLKRVTLPDGSYLSYVYDDAHRLTEIHDGQGNRIVYTLDAAGNHLEEDLYDPSSVLTRTHSRVFNTLNQLWKEFSADNSAEETTIFGYDGNSNLTTMNAPLSRNTTNEYDELNRLRKVTDPAGGITEYTYDRYDNVIFVRDPKGQLTQYRYNLFGELRELVSPDTGTTSTTFDSAGNVSTITDARNKVASQTHDALNRVTNLAYSDQTHAFEYDQGSNGVGQMTGMSDGSGTTEWQFGSLGRVSTKTQTVGGITKSVNYGYNAAGQLTTLTTPSGRVIEYEYTNNRVSGVRIDGTVVLSQVLYEPFGPTRGWTWGNGTFAVRSYDADGNPTQIDSAGLRTFSYDDAHRIAGINDLDNSAQSRTFGYDMLDRLTSTTGGGLTQSHAYDQNGNRLSQGGTSSSTYVVSSTSNQILSITGNLTRAYSYDGAGNVLSDGDRTFVYNDAGRLVRVTNAGQPTIYLYNSLDQRVAKSNASGTVYFVYDEAGRLIGEYDSLGDMIQETVWLNDIPVATLRFGSCGLAIFYIHTDQLNTPRRITKRTSNEVVWRWDSDPFGAAAPSENPSGLGIFRYNLRFPGQYFDSETGLHYNYFRDYDPHIGRYVQSDPIGLRGGASTYAYVQGDPISRIDPYGLVDWVGDSKGGSLIVLGASYFELKTKGCWNGKRGSATVLFVGAGPSLGIDASFAASNVKLKDSLLDVTPGIFEGDGFIANAGIAMGDSRGRQIGRRLAGVTEQRNGLGCSAIRLGNAGGVGCGLFKGFEFGLGVLYGKSILLDRAVEPCCD